jgi:long-chain acyl-CoA synthetase
VANTEQFKAFMPGPASPGQEVIVTAIPLYHIFALMVNFMTYFSAGADNWLVANPRDMDGFVDAAQAARSPPSSWASTRCTPAWFMHPKHPGGRLLAAAPGRRRRRGGGRGHLRQVEGDHRRFIREGYGLSETSPVVSSTRRPWVQEVHRHHRPAGAIDRHQAAGREGLEVGLGSPARSASRARR